MFSLGHGPKMSWTSESRLGREAMHQPCLRASLVREVIHKYEESGAGGDPCQVVSGHTTSQEEDWERTNLKKMGGGGQRPAQMLRPK